MTRQTIEGWLNKMIQWVIQSPLKAQQKLHIIRAAIIPLMMHSLVLGNSSRKHMQRIDVHIRNAVWKVGHLAKDTLNAFIHAPA